jgi:hypothetical protein
MCQQSLIPQDGQGAWPDCGCHPLALTDS